MPPFFSIIIPAYNAENFIERCLLSIIKQSYNNYEIIIINDGSNDRTEEISQKFIKLDNKIHLLNTKNEGVSAARNKGIVHATGEYIIFMDADDLLCPQALEISSKKITEFKKVDTVIWNFKEFSPPSKIKIHKNYIDEIYKNSKNFNFEIKHLASWGYILSKSIIDKHSVRFKETLSMSEDRVFILEYLSYSENIITMKEPFYIHVNENSSACNSPATYKKTLDQLLAINYLREIKSPKTKDIINKTIRDCCNNFLDSLKRTPKLKREELRTLEKLWREIFFRERLYIDFKFSYILCYISLSNYYKLKKHETSTYNIHADI